MSNIVEKRASGRAEVITAADKAYNQQAEGPALHILELTEHFHGDIEGENQARAIRAVRADGSGSFVGISRVVGKVGDRSGSFVLQGSGSFANKRAESEWFVVPGSGTGELEGLRGEGGFITELEHPATIWLDYWFE
ncbi:MAG: DUF3224 domain-containing protein [Nitrososphaerales archaeon]